MHFVIRKFLSSLKSLDKGLYFPIFIFFTFPFILYFFGWIKTYLVLIFLSFLHFILLKFYPYVKESPFYHYKYLKTQFYKENEKYKYFVEKKTIAFSQFFLFFSLYCSFILPELTFAFVPILLVALPVLISSVTIDIINIIYRPRLPQNISKYHPILQRRYSPVVDIIVNKVVPVCLNVGKGLLQGYGGFVIGWKALHGPLEVDPIRNFACNYFYKFPKDHLWTETSLSSWTMFKRTAAAKALPYDVAVKKFIQGENLFSEQVERAATAIIRRRTN